MEDIRSPISSMRYSVTATDITGTEDDFIDRSIDNDHFFLVENSPNATRAKLIGSRRRTAFALEAARAELDAFRDEVLLTGRTCAYEHSPPREIRLCDDERFRRFRQSPTSVAVQGLFFDELSSSSAGIPSELSLDTPPRKHKCASVVHRLTSPEDVYADEEDEDEDEREAECHFQSVRASCKVIFKEDGGYECTEENDTLKLRSPLASFWRGLKAGFCNPWWGGVPKNHTNGHRPNEMKMKQRQERRTQHSRNRTEAF
uniref:Uncharacterized protein n=1 Tax=Trieres chinensis TaxID=1514140 RepID=A0A7S2ERN7_TRICV|mmetsp:Transcript_3633/g.7773  ORF Transcript_3633/g.7773 Transcript_3633/m.7773 type:complete len:259 (+) Transcript_3633:112-888(+)